MSDSSFDSPGAIKSFLGGIGNAELSVSKEQRYAWIARTLKRTRYFALTKRDKSVVRAYLKRGSGYSHSQLTRLISQYKARGWLSAKAPVKSTFPKKYTNEDILLLAKTDEAHQQLSGSACIFRRSAIRDSEVPRSQTLAVRKVVASSKSSKGLRYICT